LNYFVYYTYIFAPLQTDARPTLVCILVAALIFAILPWCCATSWQTHFNVNWFVRPKPKPPYSRSNHVTILSSSFTKTKMVQISMLTQKARTTRGGTRSTFRSAQQGAGPVALFDPHKGRDP